MGIIENVKNAPLFQGMAQDSLKELYSYCHIKNYFKGQEIFEAGDRADYFYVILRGWVKLFRMSREGEETIIHVFGPSESFAEAAVFTNKRSYPVTSQAVTDVEVIEIPRSFFIKKIEEDSSFALRILASISSHQHYLVGQLEQVTTRTAPQRIGAFLLRFCHKRNTDNGAVVADLPYDKSLISTRLNIKPETFSRALLKLKPYGVKPDGRHIIIENPEELADFCDVPFSSQ